MYNHPQLRIIYLTANLTLQPLLNHFQWDLYHHRFNIRCIIDQIFNSWKVETLTIYWRRFIIPASRYGYIII